MKILLIKPPCTVYNIDPTLPAATLPFGIAYLASFLLSKGEDVEIIDALSEGINNIERGDHKTRVGLSDGDLEARIRRFNPDIVGVTSMFTAFDHDAHNLAALVKKINPATKVVLGGAHTSIFPGVAVQDANVDIAVRGEGEVTLWEIVKALREGEECTNILGTTVLIDGQVVTNSPRGYIEDLDTLPFPVYHLLPLQTYFKVVEDSPFSYYPRQMGIISSRGCPGDCSFCSIHSVWGHSWRGRSAGNVVDEIEYLLTKYGIKEFAFLDDSVACSKARMVAICDEIITRGLKIKWTTPNGISHWTLDEDVLDKMKASGCFRITFGIESGNLKTREFIGWKKNFSLEQATRVTKYANKIGLWTISTFILGFPYEDRQSIEDTIKFAIESDVDFAAFFLLMPFPGTRVYEVFKAEGLLNFDNLFDPLDKSSEDEYAQLGAALAQQGCQTMHFTQEELQKLLSQAYTRFWKARFVSFLNPTRTIRKVRSVRDLVYLLKIVRVGFKMGFNRIRHKQFTAHMISRVDKDSLREGISVTEY